MKRVLVITARIATLCVLLPYIVVVLVTLVPVCLARQVGILCAKASVWAYTGKWDHNYKVDFFGNRIR